MHDLVGCRFLSRLNASLRPCTERNGKEAKQATEVVATVRVPLELLCVLFLLLAAASCCWVLLPLLLQMLHEANY